MSSSRAILFIPSVREGDGIGHMRRCLDLLKTVPLGALYLAGGESEERRLREVARAANVDLPAERLVRNGAASRRWDLVILDRRKTSAEELDSFRRLGPLVGMDEGGEARKSVPYLIDTLPLPPAAGGANTFSPGYQTQPKNRRRKGAPLTGRVLVSFGGEDRTGLSGKCVAALIEEGLARPEQVTVAVGPLFRPEEYPHGVTCLVAPPELREQLHDYDLVLTSFGLTAYESISAGTAVIVLSATAYHRQLARIAGFPEIGVGSPNRKRLRRLMRDRSSLERQCAAVASGPEISLIDHLERLDFSSRQSCPACGGCGGTVVARFPERTFLRCPECSLVYEIDFARECRSYSASYFHEEYRRQYGKTYLEDFDHIRSLAEGRIRRMIRAGLSAREFSVLDVGCAYGPFLDEVRASGGSAFGLDVAEEAVDYVRAKLGIQAVCLPFEDLDSQAAFGRPGFDAVTMWWVIEHFRDLDRALRKVNTLLPKGGIFAFSTPNLRGISGRRDSVGFLDRSPRDHFSLWSPEIARAILSRFGFKVRRIEVTGHHPERFGLRFGSTGWGARLLYGVSRAAALGDTFECYAVKESEPRL